MTSSAEHHRPSRGEGAQQQAEQDVRCCPAVPGIGPITASAIVATVGDASQFRSARHFAAWIGLVPKQNSSGGKQRQGGISKQGDRYLRRLLVVGATAVIRHMGGRLAATPSGAWAKALLGRPLRSHSSSLEDCWNLRLLRPARLTSVALANKTVRIAWALPVYVAGKAGRI